MHHLGHISKGFEVTLGEFDSRSLSSQSDKPHFDQTRIFRR